MNQGRGAFIWLIGGTSDSAAIAQQLSDDSLPYVVTVTTESARRLYPVAAHVQVGVLDLPAIEQFIAQWQIKCILDASHPFACEISRQAIVCSQQSAIAYLRYERADVGLSAETARGSDTSEQTDKAVSIKLVASIDELLAGNLLQNQRVLFSLGYRHLHRFSSLRQTSQLFARILPSVDAMKGAIAAGFSAKEIIALRPPISSALEASLWQQWNITCVVAKASGLAGGELTKRQLAKQLGIELVLLQRPNMKYPEKTTELLEMLVFARKVMLEA